MCTIILVVFMLFYFSIKFAGQAVKIVTLIFLFGAVGLFLLFSLILGILSHKNFFNRYNDGWKRIAAKLLKYGLIIEMISNVICFIICLLIKIIFKF